MFGASQTFPVVNNPPANAGDAWGMGWEDFLEEETTTHSSIHAWNIPWIAETCKLVSMGLQRFCPIQSCSMLAVASIGTTRLGGMGTDSLVQGT